MFWKIWPGVTFDEVNYACDYYFWATLPFTGEACDIFDAVMQKFDRKQVYFLTTPMPNVESYDGKLRWLNKHFPGFEKRTIITQAPKSLFAKPDTLLIDDKDENIEEFVLAGGRGILVPRAWNELHGWASETLQVVKNSLEVI